MPITIVAPSRVARSRAWPSTRTGRTRPGSQSNRRLGRRGKTKAIGSVGDRSPVNVATRAAEVALLDDAETATATVLLLCSAMRSAGEPREQLAGEAGRPLRHGLRSAKALVRRQRSGAIEASSKRSRPFAGPDL
jgi:ribosomal protein L25 (general stress protein Ctc)